MTQITMLLFNLLRPYIDEILRLILSVFPSRQPFERYIPKHRIAEAIDDLIYPTTSYEMTREEGNYL